MRSAGQEAVDSPAQRGIQAQVIQLRHQSGGDSVDPHYGDYAIGKQHSHIVPLCGRGSWEGELQHHQWIGPAYANCNRTKVVGSVLMMMMKVLNSLSKLSITTDVRALDL